MSEWWLNFQDWIILIFIFKKVFYLYLKKDRKHVTDVCSIIFNIEIIFLHLHFIQSADCFWHWLSQRKFDSSVCAVSSCLPNIRIYYSCQSQLLLLLAALTWVKANNFSPGKLYFPCLCAILYNLLFISEHMNFSNRN